MKIYNREIVEQKSEKLKRMTPHLPSRPPTRFEPNKLELLYNSNIEKYQHNEKA